MRVCRKCQFLKPAFGIYVSNGHVIVVHHQNLLNYPQENEIMYQSDQKAQTPRDDHVVRGDEVLLREGPEA